MKTIFSILTLSLIPFFCLAQYFVVKVQGEVFADNILLQPKAEVPNNAQLRFGDEKAYAHVLSTTKGHFILHSKNGKKNGKGEFFAALKDALVPPNQFQAAATRGAEQMPTPIFADRYDLKAFFRDQILLVDTFAFQVDADRFPLDDQHYFELQHQLKKQTITHRLPVVEGSIQLNEAMLRNQKGKDKRKQISESRLVYVDKSQEKLQEFGPFRLRFLNEEEVGQLQKELRTIYDFVNSNSLAEFSQLHATPYLALHYGKLTKEELQRLVEGL